MREYRIMLSDRKRTLAYQKAVARSVRPGDRVADLGTGTGILSLFAASSGAGRVYAIDQTAVIPEAEKSAARNGLKDRIRFLRGHSFDLRLPEKCDVLVTETMGALGFDENILGSVIDARKRFLKNEALIIPSRISLFAVPASLPAIDRQIRFWETKRYGYDFSGFGTHAVNALYDVRLKPEQMASAPARILSLELKRVTALKHRARVEYGIERTGMLSGMVGWFEAELAPGVILNNGPGTRLHWTQTCFPFERPLPVEKGDRLGFALELASIGKHSFWSWSARLKKKAGRRWSRFSEGSTLQEYLLDVIGRKPEPADARSGLSAIAT